MLKTWNRTSSIVAFALAFVTITVYPGSVTDPVNVTKLFVLGGFAFASIGSIFKKKFLSQFSDRKIGFLACIAFLIVSLGVLFASKAPFSQSYYGTYGRNNGFLLYLLLGFIFIASLSIRENSLFKKYLWALWFAGIVNVVYAIWVLVFGDFIGWNNPYGNLLGTLGNPNFIGSFFGMFSGLVMVSILSATSTMRVKVLSLVSLPLLLLGIHQSHAVQGRVLFVVSAVIVFFYYIYSKTTKNHLILIFLFSLVPVSVLALMGTLQIGPFKTLLYKTSVSLRGEYWHAAWQTGISNPILGVGFDSFGDWYRRSRRDSAMILPGPDTVTNAAHNVYLDMFAFGGVTLFIAYLLLNIVVLVSIIRFTVRHRKFDPIFVALVAIWLSYQLQSIISINQIGLAIWGWALGGALIAYEKNATQKVEIKTPNGSASKGRETRGAQSAIQFSGVLAGVGAVLGLIVCAPPLNADAKWRSAQLSQDVKVYEQTLESTFMNPMTSMKFDTTVDTFELNKLSDLAHKYALEAIKFNPDSFNAWRNLYVISSSSSEEKKDALANLKRLDPLNKNIANTK
jgi:O-antigen ligase